MDMTQPIQLSFYVSPTTIMVAIGSVIAGALAFITWAVGTLITLWKEQQKIFKEYREANDEAHTELLKQINDNSKEIAYLKGQKHGH